MIAALCLPWLTSMAGACASANCQNPCDSCTWSAVSGVDPTPEQYQELFVTLAERGGTDDLPSIDEVETGPARSRTAAAFPCRLLPAIASTESSIREFCADSGLTVISFDCGFGVMQVTSGAANYPGIEARADINIAAGADILVQKWNGNESFGGQFGDSDPSLVESWYFAAWAYNGFIYRNNPNNPDYPASRPPFNGPASLSRGSYPYQELVWGYLHNPITKGGVLMAAPLEVTYPDPTTIPNQSGLFSVDVALPQPAHADPCVEECPPTGCPPDDARELLLDDLDAGFAIDGDSIEHADGGFRDHFRSIPPSSTATVRATWHGSAPSSGVFDFGAFIPVDPATNSSVVVRVTARGGDSAFTQNQNVSGGFFGTLGQVKLRQGTEVSVEVTDLSTDTDPAHRIGLDAFRFQWRGDGEGALDSPCSASIDCAGDAVCAAGTCVAACLGDSCTAGLSCDDTTGLCVEGSGEGEGEGDADPPVRRVVLQAPEDKGGCHCGQGDAVTSLAGLAVLAWRRRPRWGPRGSGTAAR